VEPGITETPLETRFLGLAADLRVSLQADDTPASGK
jgi:hypothetical protein